jgi:hypothetical protein
MITEFVSICSRLKNMTTGAVAKHLFSMHNTMDLIPSTEKKKKDKIRK